VLTGPALIRNLEPRPGTGVISYQVRRNGIMKGAQEQDKTRDSLPEKQSGTLDHSESHELDCPASSCREESSNVALVRQWFAEIEEEERRAKVGQGHPEEEEEERLAKESQKDQEEDEEELTPDCRASREYESRMRARGIKPGYLD